MANTFQSYADLNKRVGVYAVKKLLDHARDEAVILPFAEVFNLPERNSPIVRFRRLVPNIVSTQPLTEGVTPAPKGIKDEIIDFQVRQYGALYRLTDWILTLHEEDIVRDVTELAKEEAILVRELVMWGLVTSGTQVLYCGANATSRATVSGPINLPAVQEALRVLQVNGAKKNHEIISASEKIGTEPVAAAFTGVGHIDLENDFYTMNGFVPYWNYPNQQPVSPREIGSLAQGLRVLLARHLTYFPNAGADTGSGDDAEGMRTDGAPGGPCNVYPFVVFGKGAIGAIPLRGLKSMDFKVNKAPDDSNDPLGQRPYARWKFWFTGGILNNAWIVRIECAASELA